MEPDASQQTSLTAPLTIWLLAQLAALVAAAARMKLWAKFPAAGETLAMDELVAVQFIVSSLLFPFLCRNARASAAMIASSLPFIALAGELSSTPAVRLVACAMHLAIWLMALGLWEQAAKRLSAEMLAVALVSTLNLGGVVLVYFITEARSGLVASPTIIPLIAGIEISHSSPLKAFIPASTMLVLGAFALKKIPANFSTAVIH